MKYHGGVNAFHFVLPPPERLSPVFVPRAREELQYRIHRWVAETLLHLFGDR